MYRIQLSKTAKKFLQKIPKKHAQQVVAKIYLLAKDPRNIPVKQLKGYPKYHRIRSGEYRIIFSVEHDVLVIKIILIGKRNDDEIYKEFVNIFKK